MKFFLLSSLLASASAFAPSTSFDRITSLKVVDDKTEVRDYFNTEGFNRWNKIYSDSDEVNSVQVN